MAWHPRPMVLPGLAIVLTTLCVPAVSGQSNSGSFTERLIRVASSLDVHRHLGLQRR